MVPLHFSTADGTDDTFDASAADGATSITEYLGSADAVISSDYADVLNFCGHVASSTDGLNLDAGGGDDYIEASGGTVTIDGGAGKNTLFYHTLFHTADPTHSAVIDCGAGDIKIGGLFDTLGNGAQRVRRIGRRHVSLAEFQFGKVSGFRANPSKISETFGPTSRPFTKTSALEGVKTPEPCLLRH